MGLLSLGGKGWARVFRIILPKNPEKSWGGSGVVLGNSEAPNPNSKAERVFSRGIFGISGATVVRQHNNPPLHSPIRLLFARHQKNKI